MEDQTPERQANLKGLIWLRLAFLLGGIVALNGGYLAFDTQLRARIVEVIRPWISSGREHGFVERTYLDSDGTIHRYMVFIPHSLRPGEQLPLLVYLNGYGENGANPQAPLKNGLAHALWEDERHFPYVVVWPQCEEGDSWSRDGRSTKRAISIMQSVAWEYHTDPDRVYLSGISSGGEGTWAVAARYPDLFAAIVPVSAIVDEKTARQVAAARLPVWGYAEEDDNPLLVKSNRMAHRQLLDAGLSPHLTEVGTRGNQEKDGHDAWSYAYRDGGMYRWLAGQKLSQRGQGNTLFELVDLSKVAEGGDLDVTTDPMFGSIIKIPAGGLKSADRVQRIQSDQAVREVHLEFRGRGGVKRFGVGRFADRDGKPEQGMLIDVAINDINSGGLFSWPDQVCLATASPVAERAFLAEGWNDLRLTCESGRIVVELNGWKWIEAEHSAMPGPDPVIGFIAQGDATAVVEVRNLRVRREGSPTALSREQPPPEQLSARMTGIGNRDENRPASLEEVFECWRRREQSCSKVALAWRAEPGCRFASAMLRSGGLAEDVGQSDGLVSRLKVEHGRVQVSMPWLHDRFSLTRKAGLRDSTTIRDYQRVLKANFQVPHKTQATDLSLRVTGDDQGRVDCIVDHRGRGLRGIQYARPDVWQERVGEMDDLLWRGPLLAFLPLAKNGVGCRQEECVVLPEMVWCGGVRCVVIEEQSRTEGGQFWRRFWADPLRDFLILRSTTEQDGMQREQVDVHYTHRADGQWWPASWEAMAWPKLSGSISEFQFAGNEWLFQVARANVIHEAMANGGTTESTARSVPVGTFGFDQISNEWFEQLSNEKRRPLQPDEVMAMATSEIAPARGASRSVWVGSVLVVLAGIWIFVRRKRRRGSHV